MENYTINYSICFEINKVKILLSEIKKLLLSEAKVTVLSKSFFSEKWQLFLKMQYIKKKFGDFYQRIIPSLNRCDTCGILKCFYCSKFTASCSLCRRNTCKNCFPYKNAIDFFMNIVAKSSGPIFVILYMNF